MGNWTDEYGRERYVRGNRDELGDDDPAYVASNTYGTRNEHRAGAMRERQLAGERSRPAWFSGDRGDDSWRRGEEEIARYESRYPQARFRGPGAAAGSRRPWGQESGNERAGEGYGVAGASASNEADGAPGGRGYVSGYSSGYADGYRAAQQGQGRGNPGLPNAERGDYARGRRTGPKGYMRSDERIREDVCDRLATDHELDVSEVSVSVSSGVVTLEGTVTQRHVKYAIEDVADDVYGVSEVVNQIRVRPYGVLASE
ncbi:BON domain-containing protein [Cupriavidus sp. CV2]|uniref:BON domain-containing protein n=1 Tax=Cupriavidus ulmosensis TaxID=3065913 RepID=UPI00296B011B|nr:BON domain-containing protein [Cupriavidus sp. CV2]MDW3684204.1 BON domain-containing protein [Cupriavidus sp. CV2]